MSIHNHLKEFRARHDLTQEELAKKVGVTRQTILSIEKREQVPSLELGLRIARVFSGPIESIFNL